MDITQKELHSQLRAEAIAAREKVALLLRPLDPSKLNEHPEAKGWSIAQVLEHLLRADESYEGPAAALLAKSPRDAGAAFRKWKPTFIGRLIVGGVSGKRALKSPKVFDPGETPRNGAVEALISRETKFVQAMDDSMAYDWRALKISSPALPSWAPKMNLGDGFRIHVFHLTRHSRQIERLVGEV